MVLSPGSALPSSVMASTKARDGGGRVLAAVGVPVAQGEAGGDDRGAPERAGGAAGAFAPGLAGGGRAPLDASAPAARALLGGGVLPRPRRGACRCRGRRRRRWRRGCPVPLRVRRRRPAPGRARRLPAGPGAAAAAVAVRRRRVGGFRRRRVRGGRAGARLPLRNAGVSAGAAQYCSSSSSSQSRVRESPDMSRLVTSSPHSGSTTVSPAAVEELFDLAEKQEEFVVLDRAEAVDDRDHAGPGVVGLVRQQPATSRSASSEAVGIGCSEMPGSPWMPRPSDIWPAGTVNSGSSAPGRVQPSKATPRERVRWLVLMAEPFDLVQVQPGLGGGAGDLEDRQVPGDAAALLDLVQRGAGDVVGDQDGAGLDALGVEPQLGLAEVQDVAGVVAVAQQHAAAGVGGLGHPVDLPGRGRGEHVAAGRCRRPGPGPTRPAKAG